MKTNYIYIFFIVVLIIILFMQIKELKIESSPSSEQIKEIIISLKQEDKVINLNIEDYVLGVLACEMPALFETEALKAGAVAARTFALKKLINDKNYIFEGNTSDQCFNTDADMKEKWGEKYKIYYEKLKQVIENTKGEYITYNDEIINAYYFSTSNGYTEDAKTVFNDDTEYLISVSSPLDAHAKTFLKTISINKEEFLNKLNLQDTREIKISDIKRNNSNRVEKLKINGKEFSGIEVRKMLGLRSTDFEIMVEDKTINITTKGYGHGVGMSQYGANELAKVGYNYETILKYYYKNVEIKKENV